MKRRAKIIVVALISLGLIAWGLAMIYLPLAPIFVGAALLTEILTTRGDDESARTD